MLSDLVNPNDKNSFSNTLRKKRFAIFLSFVQGLKQRELKILDVGGTDLFWETMGFGVSEEDQRHISITLLNIRTYNVKYPNFKSMLGDARDMKEFKDHEFDIVFSNSVIEHVGTNLADQKRMADEVRRVGKYYYVQTPNYHFPMEPHFLFPGYQWLPVWLRAWMISKWTLGNVRRIPNRKEAVEYVKNTRLLSRREVKALFPDAKLYKEKFYGLVKSFILIRS
jgi:ubiquinone/menaquinone biosynthesis C-methylase UbiE